MNSINKPYRPVLVMAPGVLAGAEKVVLTGIKGLQDSGCNPLMVIIKETRAPEFALNFQKALPPDIEYIFIDSKKAFDLSLPKRLKLTLMAQKIPLILHSHGFKALIACYMMKGKTPHIHTHHGNTSHTLKVKIYEKLAMMTMKSCNHVIAVSEAMKNDLLKSLRPYKKIVVIENMLSLLNAEKIRNEKIKINANGTIIKLLFVGRLSPEKGLLSFITALESSPLKEQFTLDILGDGVEKTSIKNFIKDHDLSSRIKLHGFVSDPANFFVSPDLLILPSLREGLPMTLIESLAAGLPVIANDVGAISSLITHQHNGHLTLNNSTEEWHKALESAVKNYTQWKKIVLNEAQSIEERFSLKRWAIKTKDLYESELR